MCAGVLAIPCQIYKIFGTNCIILHQRMDLRNSQSLYFVEHTVKRNNSFLGGAWFLLFGVVPTARSLKPSCCLKVTKAVFSRCMPMGLTSVISMLGGTGIYLLSRGSKNKELAWLVPAGVFAAMQPYTLKVLMPINKSVLNDELVEEEAHETMNRWWNYHLWRTIAATGTFVYISYVLAKK